MTAVGWGKREHFLGVFRFFVLLITSALTVGCATLQPPISVQSVHSRFGLDRFFEKRIHSFGVFESLTGQPKFTFVCDSKGVRQADGNLFLHQAFKFSNGKTGKRDWRVVRTDSTHWTATANDMIGTATGVATGDTFFWEYTITLNRKNPLATVHVRQWMYKIEGSDSVMTRLIITKFGMPISEVSEVINQMRDQ